MKPYYCLKCDTTHSPIHDLYKSHQIYAIYPEEFGHPTVKELREIAKHLKSLADQIILWLSKLDPGKYEIWVSSNSLRNTLFARMKAKIRGKPTFIQRNNELINESLKLSFTFTDVPPKDEKNCKNFNGFKVCFNRIASFLTPTELKRIQKAYEIISHIKSMDFFLWRVGVKGLSEKQFSLLSSIWRKVKNNIPISKKELEILKDIEKQLSVLCYRNSNFYEQVMDALTKYDFYAKPINRLSKMYDVRKVLKAFARNIWLLGEKDISQILWLCGVNLKLASELFGVNADVKDVFRALMYPLPVLLLEQLQVRRKAKEKT